MKKFFLQFGFMILFAFTTNVLGLTAKSLEVSGQVIDGRDQTPLNLANVVSAKQHIGAVCDKSGNFKLVGIAEDDTLLISYVGYQGKAISLAGLNLSQPIIINMDYKFVPCQTILVEAQQDEDRTATSAYSIITKSDLAKKIVMQDVPEILSTSPSALFYSESGNSVGYTYLSIRGFDQRRLSISVNGVPQNDPEDHNVYWVDFPNIMENAELIQVQRGSGNGIIGYPAIGGTVNIITSLFSDKPKNELSFTAASHNTRKYDAVFSSGLINEKYSVYAKLSRTFTDGYRDMAYGDYTSYFISAARFDKKITSQINIYGGIIKDGLAYTGLPKDFMKNRELRKKNYSYWEWDNEKQNVSEYSTIRRNGEGEAFSQPHFELLNEWQITDKLKFNSTLFLVLGEGYFDYDGSWSIWSDDYFRLKQNGFDNSNPTNAIIRADVKNQQWGWSGRMSWEHKNGTLFAGAEIRDHKSYHCGSIQFAGGVPQDFTQDYKYYEYRGGVNALNFFLHEKYNITEGLTGLAEFQLANSAYKLYDEKYVGTDFTINHNFFNPKVGLNYKLNEHTNTFVSFARVSKEPRLKSYYDAAESSGGEKPNFEMVDGKYNFSKPLINSETMNDLELGLIFDNDLVSVNVNYYLMLFQNEIVKEGQLDRFGQPVTGNVPSSMHTGGELTTKIVFSKYFDLLLNANYNRNYITDGQKYVEYNDSTLVIDMKGNQISGCPEVLANAMFNFKYRNLHLSADLKYIGKFYSNNFGDKFKKINTDYPGLFNYTDNVIDPSFATNVLAGWDAKNILGLERIKLFVQVNNIFDSLYAAYAIGNEFFAADERNFAVGCVIGF